MKPSFATAAKIMIAATMIARIEASATARLASDCVELEGGPIPGHRLTSVRPGPFGRPT